MPRLPPALKALFHETGQRFSVRNRVKNNPSIAKIRLDSLAHQLREGIVPTVAGGHDAACPIGVGGKNGPGALLGRKHFHDRLLSEEAGGLLPLVELISKLSDQIIARRAHIALSGRAFRAGEKQNGGKRRQAENGSLGLSHLSASCRRSRREEGHVRRRRGFRVLYARCRIG